MKKKLFVLFFLVVTKLSVFANYPVFDQMGWLQAVEEFYQGYDQIMNMLTMIEQNYTQIQQAYERAKSWNFESLDFNDGSILSSIDIRDELKDAGSQLNRELNNIRKIKDAFMSKNIVMNGNTYSLKDLAGLGDADRSIMDLISDTAYVVKDSVEAAAKTFVQGITEEEAKSIYAKYGISPKNFHMIKEIDKKLQTAAKPIFAMAEESIEDLLKSQEKEKMELIASVTSKLFDGSGDSLTTNQALQMNGLLAKFTLDELRELNRSFRSMASYTAWQNRYQAEIEQATTETKSEWKYIISEEDQFLQEIF